MPRDYLFRQFGCYDLTSGLQSQVRRRSSCFDGLGPQTDQENFTSDTYMNYSKSFDECEINYMPKIEAGITQQPEEEAHHSALKVEESENPSESGATPQQQGELEQIESSGMLLLREIEERLAALSREPVDIPVPRNVGNNFSFEGEEQREPLWEYCPHMMPKRKSKKKVCPSHNVKPGSDFTLTKYKWVIEKEISFMILESPISLCMNKVLFELVARKVKTFVRVSSADYRVEEIRNAGIDVIDICFDSSCVPSKTQMAAWLAVAKPIPDQEKSIVAVHGPGRAHFMVAVALLEMKYTYHNAMVAVKGPYCGYLCYNQIRYLSTYKKDKLAQLRGSHLRFA